MSVTTLNQRRSCQLCPQWIPQHGVNRRERPSHVIDDSGAEGKGIGRYDENELLYTSKGSCSTNSNFERDLRVLMQHKVEPTPSLELSSQPNVPRAFRILLVRVSHRRYKKSTFLL